MSDQPSTLTRLPLRDDHLTTVLGPLSARFAVSATALDRSGAFPFGNFAELHAHGLIAHVAPRRIIEAIARAEPATAANAAIKADGVLPSRGQRPVAPPGASI